MTITILTLFPDFFSSALASSILQRGQNKQLLEYQLVNIRDFATDKHKTTDDRPFGGGAGMVMKVEPIDKALQNVPMKGEAKSKIILTSAKGKIFDQAKAELYASLDHLTIICGHYEGVDERVTEHLVDEEVRIGDYVLTGGEPAALVIADAVSRLIPGVLGNERSLVDESHGEAGQLAAPVYTQPRDYKGWQVPEVLLSGNHAEIEKWKASQRRRS